MKILVTGATGFVGRYVVENLLAQNCTVITTSTSRTKAEQMSWYGRVEYINCDLNDLNLDTCFDFFGRPDLLIHLAWQGLPAYKESFHIERNLVVHRAFLKAMVTGGLKNLAVTGTCYEYGMKDGPLSEDVSPAPANSYAIAKNSLRKFLLELNAEIPFSLKWIRLFYLYGDGQNEKSILPQLKAALRNGEPTFNMSKGDQLRDYLPIETAAKYITAVALNNTFSGTINCCSGQPISIKQLIENYLHETGQHIALNLGYYPYSDYEPMNFWGDNTKLLKLLG